MKKQSKKQWRFKTKIELINEFGNPQQVKGGWSNQMDKFFGKPYNKRFVPTKTTWVFGYDGKWTISPEMLTTRGLPKLTSDGIIIKVGMKLYWTPDDTKYRENLPVVVNKIYGEWGETTIEIICHCPDCIGEAHTYLPEISELTRTPI